MQDITLIDGGLGQEIYRKAGQPAHPMWSAKVMMDDPEVVKEVHREFMQAGAQVLTINTYTCTPTRLDRDGEKEWFEDLQIKAYDIAAKARDSLGLSAGDVQIAACLPPLIGSYTADPRSFGELKEEYRQIVDIQASRSDLFIIETISVIREAQAATEAALESGKPVLLSLTLSDEDPEKLRSGESIQDALKALKDYNLQGLLFNCSFPETIAQGLNHLKDQPYPYGGYANGFTSVEPLKPGGTVDALAARKDLNADKYAELVLQWIAQGATIVGGCCEVGPSYIAELRDRIQAKGYTIKPLS